MKTGVKTRLRLLVLALICALPLGAHAGGFQVALQGTAQSSMGGCGAGLAFDPAAIYFNPGGVALRRGKALSFSTCFISPHIAYRAPAPSAYTDANVPVTGTPFNMYAVWSLNPKWTVGLGVYTPFGSTIRYPERWAGEYLIRELSLKTIFIQPTLCYRISDQLGVGFAPVIAVGNVSLRRALPLQDSTTGLPGEVQLESKGRGFGFNTGIYWEPTAQWSLGLTIHSGVGFQAKNGTATFLVPSSLDSLFPDTRFSSKIRIPWVFSLGAGWKVTRTFKLAADINFVTWSAYDTLAFDFEDNTTKLADSKSARNYGNAFTFRGGMDWRLAEFISLRAGAYFDLTPVKAGYLTPESPDANRLGLTAGAAVDVNKRLHLEANLLWVEGMKREDVNLETGFGGTWKSRAWGAGFGVNYYFSLPSNPRTIQAVPTF